IYRVEGGYFLPCPGCGRWYMHHCALGYVEGVQKERSIPDALVERMPDECGFIRAILADPHDAALRSVYADSLEHPPDARSEALRIKCEMASIPEGDGRSG